MHNILPLVHITFKKKIVLYLYLHSHNNDNCKIISETNLLHRTTPRTIAHTHTLFQHCNRLRSDKDLLTHPFLSPFPPPHPPSPPSPLPHL